MRCPSFIIILSWAALFSSPFFAYRAGPGEPDTAAAWYVSHNQFAHSPALNSGQTLFGNLWINDTAPLTGPGNPFYFRELAILPAGAFRFLFAYDSLKSISTDPDYLKARKIQGPPIWTFFEIYTEFFTTTPNTENLCYLYLSKTDRGDAFGCGFRPRPDTLVAVEFPAEPGKAYCMETAYETGPDSALKSFLFRVNGDTVLRETFSNGRKLVRLHAAIFNTRLVFRSDSRMYADNILYSEKLKGFPSAEDLRDPVAPPESAAESPLRFRLWSVLMGAVGLLFICFIVWRRRRLAAVRSPEIPTRGQEIFARFEAFARANISRDLSMDDIEAHMEMTTANLRRFVIECTGKNIKQYLLALKMDHARRLLATTDLSVLDVMMSVGYTNPAHFTLTFRKHTGMTPTDFRKESKS